MIHSYLNKREDIMKFLTLLEKHLVVGCAAAAAMHVIMNRQQDLGIETSLDTLQKRAQETAFVAVKFANALWLELSSKGA